MSKEKSSNDLYRGSLVTLRRSCGKPNCRCRDGKPHETPALSYSVKGRTHMLTLRDEDTPRVKEGLARYRKERAALEAKVLKGVQRLRRKIQSRKKRERNTP